jgi:hypothetical protein
MEDEMLGKYFSREGMTGGTENAVKGGQRNPKGPVEKKQKDGESNR